MPTFDMITSLASMTSRASWASKSYLLGDFPAIRNLSSLNDLNDLNSLKGLNDLNSFILSKNRSLNLEWIITNQLFYGFLALSCWRLWNPQMFFQQNSRVISLHLMNVHILFS